jgi:hypothetical protein
MGSAQAINEAEIQAAREAREEYEREMAERGLLGERREQRAKEGLEGLEDEKKQARSMALLQAGLSILSADPSRGALAAIGEGSLQGLGAYKGSLKDLTQRKDKLDDKLDEIEDLRRQESIASGKEMRDLKRQEQAAVVQGQRYMHDIMKRFTDIDFEESKMIFNAAAQERTATIGASASRGQLALLEALRDDPGLMEAYQSMQAGKFNPRAEYAKYLAKREGQASLTPVKTYEEFLQSIGVDGTMNDDGFTVKGSKPKQ